MKINNPSSVEHLNIQLRKLVNFLTPLLPLANSHLVQFISQDQWNKFLPAGMQQDLLNLPLSSLNSVPTAELYEFPADFCNTDAEIYSSLRSFLATARGFHAENLDILSPLPDIKNEFNEHEDKVIASSMNKKKAYEVKNMSRLIATIFEDKKPDWIVDIGSGLGYLSSTLLIHSKLNVFALDSSRSNIISSLKQSQSLFERFEHALPSSGRRKKQKSTSGKEENVKTEKFVSSFNAFNGRFLGLTKYIMNNENLPALISSVQTNNNEGKDIAVSEICELGLVGLHTCGNLAPTSLKLFVNNSSVQFMCNVGCCYHLLVEEFCEDFFIKQKIDSQRQLDERYHCPELDPFHRRNETMSVDAGFPLCSYLRSIQFCLGRNARDLASKPSARLSINDKNLQPLFWRALFEQIVIEIFGSWPEDKRVGRKINKGCNNFYEYCQKCFLSIGLSNNKLTEKEIYYYYEKYKSKEDEIVRFFLLKSSLAPLIETLINLDRLIYLHEQGFVNSHLVKIFDEAISPRCIAILAFK